MKLHLTKRIKNLVLGREGFNRCGGCNKRLRTGNKVKAKILNGIVSFYHEKCYKLTKGPT